MAVRVQTKYLRAPIPLFLLFFVFLTSCNGQEKSKPSEANQTKSKPFSFINKQGVDTSSQISEYVVAVFEDTKGNLWFGTISDGAVRYDGKTLTYFSTKDGLCDNTIVSIAEDNEGNIWFGTHAGASKYDGKTFVNFIQKDGLHGVGCKILVDSKGNIWAGTNHGAFRYNNTKFSPFNIPNPVVENKSYKWEIGKVWDIKEDKKGNIWFGRDGLGACRFDGSSFTHFTQKEGLCSNTVSRIVEDNQGNIWFGCLSSDLPKAIKEGGVCHYDGKAFTKYTDIEGLSKNDIYTVYVDKAGRIWVGATGLGVYGYDGQTFQFYKGTNRMDLTWSMGIQSMLEDRSGRFWLGFSGGLFRFNGTTIINVPKTGLSK